LNCPEKVRRGDMKDMVNLRIVAICSNIAFISRNELIDLDGPRALAQPPPVGYPPAAVYGYPANVPVRPSQDDGTAIAALPPEDQPRRSSAQELSPQFRRTVVDYPTIEPPGTIIIDTPNTYLYLTISHGKAASLRHRCWP
jgi:lipoprotein-anchoring transpeptidase ErfK/SrfK